MGGGTRGVIATPGLFFMPRVMGYFFMCLLTKERLKVGAGKLDGGMNKVDIWRK